MSPGDVVLVIGAGPIGLFAARTAVLDAAARTFVVDRLADRLALVAALGADPLTAERALEEIIEATSGRASTW